MVIPARCDDFVFEGQCVRVVRSDDETWWVLADVCQALELADTNRTASRLDADEKGTHTVSTPGGPQDMLIVSEPGLYKLIATSRKPVAKRFDRWVRHEVLPSIRKTGSYGVPTNRPTEIQTLLEPLDLKLDDHGKRIATIEVIAGRIDDNVRYLRATHRKQPSTETLRILAKVVAGTSYHGVCPCNECNHYIVDSEGQFLDGEVNIHHQNGVHDARAESLIPLHVDCHKRVTGSTTARNRLASAFATFQFILSRLPMGQIPMKF